MADESGHTPIADEMERTALGIVMALERDDPAALRELFFTEDGPIDDLELIVTLGRLSAFLAGKLGAQEDPPADATAVLARLALEWGGPAS
jgi:hypothetical protein